MKKISNKFKSKPNYDILIKLGYTLDVYLITRIDKYIFFKYYNGDLFNILNIELIKEFNIKNILILKEIYEYDYKVFKTLLFLYGDLEYYLEGQDNVKDTLIVDTENLDFLNFKFKKEIKSYEEFLYLISIRKPINLGTNLEDLGMFKKMLKYDVYSKLESLNTKYKNHLKIKTYKKYKKYNNLINNNYIDYIRQLQANKEKINSVYYNSYIEKGYEEGKSEINKDLTFKYKEKIKNLDNALKELLKILNKNDETNA